MKHLINSLKLRNLDVRKAAELIAKNKHLLSDAQLMQIKVIVSDLNATRAAKVKQEQEEYAAKRTYSWDRQ